MHQVYQWVDWFEELALRVADNSHEYLVERAKQVEWFSPDDDRTELPLFKYGDESVDPFSFIYTLASMSNGPQFQRVFQNVTEVFGLTHKLDFDQSEDCFLFPTPSKINTLFHRGSSSEPDPKLLWELFEAVVKTPESIDESLFNRSLSVKGVGITNLTQALFLISPRVFFPTDKKFREIFGRRHTLPSGPLGFDWSQYQEILKDIKQTFECEFFEVNIWVYLTASKRHQIVNHKSCFYQLTVDEPNSTLLDEWQAENFVLIDKSNHEFDRINRGDIVLLRQGSRINKGIGIVLSKEEKGSHDAGDVVHVVWMNKRETVSDTECIASGFSQAGKVEELFRKEDAYELNFEILDRYCSPDVRDERIDPVTEVKSNQKKRYPFNQILYGPPGTGKTFAAEKLAVKIVDGDQDGLVDVRERYQELCEEGRIEFVTFHQNYAYEDFIEGIRPKLEDLKGTNIEYERKNGLFKRLCTNANDNRPRAYVLIIDEINRGNISKIFGELITLIEDSRRLGAPNETLAKLPSSNERFGVPGNLYIIGTMNTADRSIQLLDTALRRRFHFEELMPDPSHSELSNFIDGINLSALLSAMNERIVALRDREHQIGHTYFLDLNSIEELASCFKYRVFPLLQEYFFDDWRKIKIVLGNNNFVISRDTKQFKLGEEFEEQREIVYERVSLNDEIWLKPEQYRQIYE